MKKYKVNVNGTVYEVAIEVMDGAAPVAAAPAASSNTCYCAFFACNPIISMAK